MGTEGWEGRCDIAGVSVGTVISCMGLGVHLLFLLTKRSNGMDGEREGEAEGRLVYIA